MGCDFGIRSMNSNVSLFLTLDTEDFSCFFFLLKFVVVVVDFVVVVAKSVIHFD